MARILVDDGVEPGEAAPVCGEVAAQPVVEVLEWSEHLEAVGEVERTVQPLTSDREFAAREGDLRVEQECLDQPERASVVLPIVATGWSAASWCGGCADEFLVPAARVTSPGADADSTPLLGARHRARSG